MRAMSACRARGSALTVRWVERAVVVGVLCPKASWMRRRVTPASRPCVAELWRRVCTEARLVFPLGVRATLKASCPLERGMGGEEPQGMAGRFPGLTQECSGALRQRDRAVFGAFAVPHGHEHAGPVHVRHWEVGALWQAQTTGGERRQTGPRAQQRQGREKGVHRFDTEENRELLLAGCTHKGQGGPRALEGVLVAERDTAQGKSAGTTRRVCDVLEREERVAEFFCGDAGG